MSEPKGEPTLRQSKSALLQAAEAAVADQKVRAAEPRRRPPQSTGRGRRLVMGLLIVVGGVLLAWRPDWLAGPSLPRETPAVQAASVTMSLAQAVSSIKAYQATHGRLPATAQAAGVTNPAISYRALANGEFAVSAQGADSLITVRSTDSLQARVVAAIRTLQRRS